MQFAVAGKIVPQGSSEFLYDVLSRQNESRHRLTPPGLVERSINLSARDEKSFLWDEVVEIRSQFGKYCP